MTFAETFKKDLKERRQWFIVSTLSNGNTFQSRTMRSLHKMFRIVSLLLIQSSPLFLYKYPEILGPAKATNERSVVRANIGQISNKEPAFVRLRTGKQGIKKFEPYLNSLSRQTPRSLFSKSSDILQSIFQRVVFLSEIFASLRLSGSCICFSSTRKSWDLQKLNMTVGWGRCFCSLCSPKVLTSCNRSSKRLYSQRNLCVVATQRFLHLPQFPTF